MGYLAGLRFVGSMAQWAKDAARRRMWGRTCAAIG
jgi:hypothetical protein